MLPINSKRTQCAQSYGSSIYGLDTETAGGDSQQLGSQSPLNLDSMIEIDDESDDDNAHNKNKKKKEKW